MSNQEIVKLEGDGVFPLDCASIESLYYGADARSAVAGGDLQRLEQAKRAGLDAAKNICEKLAQLAAKQRTRERLFGQLPASDKFRSEMELIEVRPGEVFKEVRGELERLIAQNKLDTILSKFSAKDGTIRRAIATSLGFTSPGEYENAVVKAASDNATFRETLSDKFTGVHAALGGEESTQAVLSSDVSGQKALVLAPIVPSI